MNPTDTARALVTSLEQLSALKLGDEIMYGVNSPEAFQRKAQIDDARAALLAHVAEMAQQLARYKEIYESNSAAFIAIRKAFGIEADETVVPYILKYAPPLATRPTEARDA